MIVQVGGDAARVIPIFTEAEEPVRTERNRCSGAEPLFPIDVVVAGGVRAGRGVNRPPFAGIPISSGALRLYVPCTATTWPIIPD